MHDAAIRKTLIYSGFYCMKRMSQFWEICENRNILLYFLMFFLGGSARHVFHGFGVDFGVDFRPVGDQKSGKRGTEETLQKAQGKRFFK